MKNFTHYFFSVGIINIYSLFYVKDPSLCWFTFISSFICSLVALFPNLIDHYAGASLKFEGIQLKRYRHPLTHSPWTIAYFFPILYILDVFKEPIFLIICVSIFLSWTSHLLLDSFNSEGIPLGKNPVISNHPSKHYQWLNFTQTRKLRFARIEFYDQKVNSRIVRIGLFLISINLSNLVLNYSFVIIGLIK